MNKILTVLIFVITAIIFYTEVADAEYSYSMEIFAGEQFNIPAPLSIKQKGEETIKINRARYETDAWTWPNSPYYAIRIGLWNKDAGWELELIHEKIILKNKPEEVQHFEISHGYNLITINRAWKSNDYFNIIWHVGAGIVLAHPETIVRNKAKSGGSFPDGFYVAGPTAQIAAGKRFYLWSGLFCVVEAKFTASYAFDVPVADGHAVVPNAAIHGLLGMGYEF